jgi:hypothetical protein
LITAVSLTVGPDEVAFATEPSLNRTWIAVAPSTTWLAVTMSPTCRTRTVPSARALPPLGPKGETPPCEPASVVTLMSTTPGLSRR